MQNSPHWRHDPARKLIFMFAGQGSHYFQMGRELYEGQPAFLRELELLNTMARDICGVDVIAAIYDDARKKHHLFDDILHTHPAIFIVEYALARALIAHGVAPDGVLGVSMGNFAAATVAGSMSAEQALTTIARQARTFHDHAQPGAMLAVLGEARLYEQHPLLQEHSDIAAVNTPASFVLALPERSRATVEAYLREHKINFQRMAVSRAFHSRWIDAVKPAADWREQLAAPTLPWYCSTHQGALTAPASDYWWHVVRQPIQLVSTVRGMEDSGQFDYLDLSPSGTLAVVLKYLLTPDSKASYMGVMSAFGSDLDRFNKLIKTVAA